MSVLELKHDNHYRVAFVKSGGELRLRIESKGVVNVPDGATFVITADHDGRMLFVNQAGVIEFDLPDNLDDGAQVAIVGRSGGVTFDPQGATTLDPASFEVGDGLFVVTLLYRDAGDGTWYVFGPDAPNTVTVVYDSGWPASRPAAAHVYAVGGSAEPTWLTADDIWFEDVGDDGDDVGDDS